MTTFTPTLADRSCARLEHSTTAMLLSNNHSEGHAPFALAGSTPHATFLQRFLLALMRCLAVPAV
jgi:hypothetical protein